MSGRMSIGAGGLDGVAVDDGAPVALFDGAADLGDRLERADFVVGGHDRDEDGVVADGRGDGCGVDEAFGVDGQDGDFEALVLQALPWGGARRGARWRR